MSINGFIAAVVTTAVLVVARLLVLLYVPPEHATVVGSYEAISHVFVGGLGGFWLARRDAAVAWLFWVLCGVEVFCAVAARM